MSLLLESIRYEHGQFCNLDLHEQRMMHARRKILGISKKINLSNHLIVPATIKKGRYKCRVLYDANIKDVQFDLYERKKIKLIKLVKDDSIRYTHKYADRSCLTKHTEILIPEEELIIVKKGLLRDASYSNIALFNGQEWHTPTYPLLKGTKRQELLNKGLIISKKLKPEHLNNYQRISFINALNDLDELSLAL